MSKLQQPKFKPAAIPPAMRAKILRDFAGDSKIQPVPSLIEALARQDIESEPEFQALQTKMIDWYKNQAPEFLKAGNRLDYLPDSVISFIIPLDFYINLPENYLSGNVGGTDQEIDALDCVGNFTKIIPVGKSAIKISYLVVSICDNESVGLLRRNTSEAIGQIFYKAVGLANQVIASLQAIPNRHNHLMHPITAYSCPGDLHYFVFARRNNNPPHNYTCNWREDIATDIMRMAPLEKKELKLFQACHVSKVATNDKVFKLISLYQHAVNSRCYGEDDQAILDADTFVEYSLGYLYCEIRLYCDDDPADVYEDYKKMRRTDEIWEAVAKMLDYKNGNELRQKVGYGTWKKACHMPRNLLHHSFMTEPHSEDQSGKAVYFAGDVVRKLCDLVIIEVDDPAAPITIKAKLLQKSTLFFKDMIEKMARRDSVVI